MKIASRLSGISASPTMEVMQEAQKLKGEGIDVVDLGPGEPDFPTPDAIKQAGIDAIQGDFTKYTASAGIPELRQAVADHYNARWGSNFSLGNVVISCGAKHSIYNVCMALFEQGDEVLLPVPYWVTFPEVIKITGARPVEVVTPQEEGFILRVSDLQAHLTECTRGLIVNSPSNPTGAVIPGEEIERLVDWSRNNGVFALFDECYDYFTYGDQAHVSAARFVHPAEEGFAVIGSTSKTYSMTGWRIGYCIANTELIQKIIEFQSHQTGNPSSISQKAAVCALGSDPGIVESMTAEYAKRREYVLRSLEEIPGFHCVPPHGAFYVFPRVSDCMARLGIETSAEFARFLIQEARVATVPGSAFGMEGYIRISYATSMDRLGEAFSRIKEAVGQRLSRTV